MRSKLTNRKPGNIGQLHAAKIIKANFDLKIRKLMRASLRPRNYIHSVPGRMFFATQQRIAVTWWLKYHKKIRSFKRRKYQQ
jgi:hypothetical protein